MNDESLEFLAWLAEQPDPHETLKKFTEQLEKYCEENGIVKGYYCPYVPLQM